MFQDPAEQLGLAKEAVEGRIDRDGLRGRRKRSAVATDAHKRGSSSRITLPLEHGSSLSWLGGDRCLDSLIDHLQDLLGKAKKARAKGWELDTFARALKDQARCE
jgi:hypothetical protein